MSIEKINHYSFTTDTTSVYDEEAMTALELAGRTAAKVNECVDEFNRHEKKCNNMVDQTYGYLKQNLKGTLSDILEGMHDSGEFAEIIANESMPMLANASGLANDKIVFVDNIPGIVKYESIDDVEITGCENAKILEQHIKSGATLKFGSGVYPFERELSLVSNLYVTSDNKTATLYFPDSRGFVADNRGYYHSIDFGNINIISKSHCFDIRNDGVSYPNNLYWSNFHDMTLKSYDGSCFYAGDGPGCDGDRLVFQCKFTNLYVAAEHGAGIYGVGGLGIMFTNISDNGECFTIFRNCYGTWVDCNTSFGGSGYFLYIDDNMPANYNAHIIMRNVNMENLKSGGIFVVDRNDIAHGAVYLENVSVVINVPGHLKSSKHPITLGLYARYVTIIGNNINNSGKAWEDLYSIPFANVSFKDTLQPNAVINGGVSVFNRTLNTVQNYNVAEYKISQSCADYYKKRMPFYDEIGATYFHGYRGRVYKNIELTDAVTGVVLNVGEHYDGIVFTGGQGNKTFYYIRPQSSYRGNEDGATFYVRNDTEYTITLANGMNTCKWKFLESGTIPPNSVKIFKHFYHATSDSHHYVEIGNVEF